MFEPTLSALETLQLHAHLRLPNDTSRSERNDIVSDALQAMGLARSARTQVQALLEVCSLLTATLRIGVASKTPST